MADMLRLAGMIRATLEAGGKLLIFGNGGSAADAQHMAAEFVNRYLIDRRPLPALALTTDSSIMTALSNDYGYKAVFERQVRALGQPGDLLLVLSATGNDVAVLEALDAAHERDMMAVVLTGRTGGNLAAHVRETDVLICVPHDRAARVRETHTLILHCLADGVDSQLLGDQEMPL